MRVCAQRHQSGLIVRALHSRHRLNDKRHVIDPIVEKNFALGCAHPIPRSGKVLRLVDRGRQLLPSVFGLLGEAFCRLHIRLRLFHLLQ
jgi:hypothetical protein